MSKMTGIDLNRVRRARDRRHKVCAQAQAEYVDAIRQAHERGHSYQEIADAAGLKTRSAVAYLLNGDPRKEQADG